MWICSLNCVLKIGRLTSAITLETQKFSTKFILLLTHKSNAAVTEIIQSKTKQTSLSADRSCHQKQPSLRTN